jgi:hypothetical protein
MREQYRAPIDPGTHSSALPRGGRVAEPNLLSPPLVTITAPPLSTAPPVNRPLTTDRQASGRTVVPSCDRHLRVPFETKYCTSLPSSGREAGNELSFVSLFVGCVGRDEQDTGARGKGGGAVVEDGFGAASASLSSPITPRTCCFHASSSPSPGAALHVATTSVC